jgi:hypothetical protein
MPHTTARARILFPVPLLRGARGVAEMASRFTRGFGAALLLRTAERTEPQMVFVR